MREHCVIWGGVRDGRERGELTLIGCAPVKGRLDVGVWVCSISIYNIQVCQYLYFVGFAVYVYDVCFLYVCIYIYIYIYICAYLLMCSGD